MTHIGTWKQSSNYEFRNQYTALTSTWLVILSRKSLLTLNSYGQLVLNKDVSTMIVFIITISQIFSWE